MGLAISVGFLADMKQYDEEGLEWGRSALAKVQAYLQENGFPTWDEPEDLDHASLGLRRHISSFPYSTIHYLRRAYALCTEYPDRLVKPVGPEGLDATQHLVDDATTLLSSHLLCHSDSAGWYVPVELRDPLFAPPDSGIDGGGMIGSSQALLRELRVVAPAIGVQLEVDGTLSDDEAARVYEASGEDAEPFFNELTAWLALHETALASVRIGSAIRFH